MSQPLPDMGEFDPADHDQIAVPDFSGLEIFAKSDKFEMINHADTADGVPFDHRQLSTVAFVQSLSPTSRLDWCLHTRRLLPHYDVTTTVYEQIVTPYHQQELLLLNTLGEAAFCFRRWGRLAAQEEGLTTAAAFCLQTVMRGSREMHIPRLFVPKHTLRAHPIGDPDEWHAYHQLMERKEPTQRPALNLMGAMTSMPPLDLIKDELDGYRARHYS